MNKNDITPNNHFSAFSPKRTILLLVIFLALFIANELFFRWARQLDSSEIPTFILSGFQVLRWMIGVPLFLIAFFYVVRLSDDWKGETILDHLTVIGILRKI